MFAFLRIYHDAKQYGTRPAVTSENIGDISSLLRYKRVYRLGQSINVIEFYQK